MISGGGRWSRTQIAAVVGVVVVVVGLFGFMALNSGPGGSSDEVSAQGATPTTSTSTTADAGSSGPTVTAAPMPAAVPSTEVPPLPDEVGGESEIDAASPVDAQRFCTATQGITALEDALAGAFGAQDLVGVRRAVAEHRAGWTAAVDDLIDAGPPLKRVEFERYRDVYLWVLGVVDTDGNLERIGNGYPAEYRDRGADPNDPIHAAVGAYCG